jgi:CBS domain-containing protein
MRTSSRAPAAEGEPGVLRASDLMQADVITVQASDSLHEVERALVDSRISGAPVLDDNGHLLGIVSMHDVMRHHAELGDLPTSIDPYVFRDVVPESEPVAFERDDSPCAGDLMTTDVVTVPPEATIHQVAATMVNAHVHRVLVRGERRLLGIITSMDMMRALAGSSPPPV